jgi:hypothetical protein
MASACMPVVEVAGRLDGDDAGRLRGGAEILVEGMAAHSPPQRALQLYS